MNHSNSTGQAGLVVQTNHEAGLSGMDLDVYNAAKEGNVDALWQHRDHLDQIQMLTPTKNSVLHIHIACSSNPTTALSESDSEEVLVRKSANFVGKILEMCPTLLFQLNENGDTALHIAARCGSAHVVEVLLLQAAKEARADVQMLIRTTNKEKDTALHEAARFNHLGVVEILIREDPEFLYYANNAGDTPLYLAAERGCSDLVIEILNTCEYPTYGGRNGRTALHAAVICNDEKMTRELLKHTKMDLTKEVDGRGWTPLHFAALLGHTSIAKQLLKSDRLAAYIGDKECKLAPLHIAASEGHDAVMRELVSHCPDCCELVDHKGRNVLHYASKGHQGGAVEDLILKDPWLNNVLLNGKDADGNTPFHLLACFPYYTAADRFIGDDRVDKMAFNKENPNALDIILADDTSPPTCDNELASFKRSLISARNRVAVALLVPLFFKCSRHLEMN